MKTGVTGTAESNHILLGVIPRLTAKLFVMDFEIAHGAARLTSPAVAMKDLVAKLVV